MAPGRARVTRIGIVDAVEGWSVPAPPALAAALVAAVAADPARIEALLRAADAIYFGAARILVGALIAHDRWHLLHRSGFGPAPGRDGERDAWPITDHESFRLARQPASAGLLWFDLEQRTLEHCDVPGGVALVGEVPIFDGHTFLPRTVTYDLRGRWNVVAV
jgi:hypothetical protein